MKVILIISVVGILFMGCSSSPRTQEVKDIYVQALSGDKHMTTGEIF